MLNGRCAQTLRNRKMMEEKIKKFYEFKVMLMMKKKNKKKTNKNFQRLETKFTKNHRHEHFKHVSSIKYCKKKI